MFYAKVKAFLSQKGIELENKRVGIAVSGGPDSLSLLHFMQQLSKQECFQLVVIHVDHMFRGEESYEDAKFVERYCQKSGIPFHMQRIDVSAHMKETGKSSQIAARDCRYRFFEQVMQREALDYIALGHHGDDQIETMLMRMTRGSSGLARAGMPVIRPFSRGAIIRPFLCLSRNEIDSYVETHHLEPRIDPSNVKEIYSRNRFRKNILPFLKRENPQVHHHFQRLSEDLSEDEVFMQELAEAQLNSVTERKSASEILLYIDRFTDVAKPLQRRVIQLILNYLYQERPSSLSATHIENVFSLITHPHPSGTLHFPNGLTVVRSYDCCFFSTSKKTTVQPYLFQIQEPGNFVIPEVGEISMHYVDHPLQEYQQMDYFLVKADIALPLTIRTRKNGDRMKLKGINGSKKLKDIFIDQKIPRQKRDLWPVVTDASGNIIWLPGLKKSDQAAEYSPDTSYIFLKYIKQ